MWCVSSLFEPHWIELSLATSLVPFCKCKSFTPPFKLVRSTSVIPVKAGLGIHVICNSVSLVLQALVALSTGLLMRVNGTSIALMPWTGLSTHINGSFLSLVQVTFSLEVYVNGNSVTLMPLTGLGINVIDNSMSLVRFISGSSMHVNGTAVSVSVYFMQLTLG